tara:strand:- start:540 stop:704 length:165 start_codon:yes stop_codon:yes gene_type:complete
MELIDDYITTKYNVLLAELKQKNDSISVLGSDVLQENVENINKSNKTEDNKDKK